MKSPVRIALAGLLSIVTLMAMMPATAAMASEDDGKIVATKRHVDSPKTFWEHDGFVLKSEHGGVLDPLEDTVNWVGKGYSYRTGEQQYIWRMNDDPLLADLARHGDRWYMAPALPDGWDPIWAGFGADENIPTERFRDASFSLDMVGFDGPGRMEAINYWPDEKLNRLYSSHDDRYRLAYLVKGSHTHNNTLFTKPGRYVVTYRTTARGKDGTLIASKDTPMVWQVGGTSPAETAGAPLERRYDAAPGGAPATPYAFSVEPHAGRERDGDDQLTDLRFDAGDPSVNGTVTLFIDGYHLADVPVRSGTAVWPEMIGSGQSEFQAVFVPSEGSGTPRWISMPVRYGFGQEATATTSTQAGDALPQGRTQDPAPAFPVDDYTPSDMGFTLSTKPLADHSLSVTVTANDPKLRMMIDGGIYLDAAAKPTDEPERFISMPVGDTQQIWLGSSFPHDGLYIRLRFIAHALMGVGGGDVALEGMLDPSRAQIFTGVIPADGIERGADADPGQADDGGADGDGSGQHGGNDPDDGSGQANGGSGQTDGDGDDPGDAGDAGDAGDPGRHGGADDDADARRPDPANPGDGRVTLSKGHVDFQAYLDDNGTLAARLRDDTMQHASGSVDRPLSTVALALPDNAMRTREGGFANSRFDFLGEPGSSFYYTDAVWDNDHIWPGWSTVGLDSARARNVTMSIEPDTLPEGGAYHLFASDSFGRTITRYLGSTGSHEMAVPDRTHAHASWAFTRPGVYLMNVRFSATVDGRKQSTPDSCVAFLVGAQAITAGEEGRLPDCAAGKTPHGTDPGEGGNAAEKPDKKPDKKPGPDTDGPADGGIADGPANGGAADGHTSGAGSDGGSAGGETGTPGGLPHAGGTDTGLAGAAGGLKRIGEPAGKVSSGKTSGTVPASKDGTGESRRSRTNHKAAGGDSRRPGHADPDGGDNAGAQTGHPSQTNQPERPQSRRTAESGRRSLASTGAPIAAVALTGLALLACVLLMRVRRGGTGR